VGADTRNRCLLSPYGARTGRNTPSNAKFVFGPSKWFRGLIKPASGFGLAYCDWANQEIAIAAALSGDSRLIDAYRSGDPYLAFAKQAGLAPSDATKETHRAMRDLAKTTVLGINYGMSAYGIAQRIGIGEIDARHMLQRHRETYRDFWTWTDGNINTALLGAPLQTVFGWPLRLGAGSKANTRSLQNYPMQANGAEMMRLAASMATEAGLTICAPVHDAFLLEAPLEHLETAAANLKQIMVEASRLVLRAPGLACRVDVNYVRWPDRYMSESGSDMWQRIMKLLTNVEREVA
jgi:DNA polymerase I-like protein with 3'-5' exonuclease and polymerase domains